MKEKCQNCGHNCHCKGYCLQNYGEETETVCCTHCRHEKNNDTKDGFDENEIKYDSMDYDSFNGA